MINEHFPSLGPRWGTDGMWLWPLWVVLGFGEPWSVGCSCLLGRALLTDVRLLGWVGMLMGGWNPERSHRHCPSSGGSRALARVLRRGEKRTHTLCPVFRAALLFSEPLLRVAHCLQLPPDIGPVSFCPCTSWMLTPRPLFLWPVWFWFWD